MKFPVPETYCDVQLAFAMSMGAESQVSLQRAVEHCNLPDALDFHNAVHDATYTAMLAGKVAPAMLEMAQRTTGGRGKKGGTPPRGASWAGPFESAEALLGSRSGRLAVCPKCGEKVRVSCWQYVGDGPYYARFSCPEHKGHILKLTAKRDKTGRLWASGQVLEATAEHVAELKALRQADGFRTFQVKADQKSKKRRYHRHGKRKNAG